jgi:LytS/YehU family sensor histidine kinase
LSQAHQAGSTMISHQYAVNIAENTSTGSIMIPPMLIQPFFEKAIWHGLMQKRTKVELVIPL